MIVIRRTDVPHRDADVNSLALLDHGRAEAPFDSRLRERVPSAVARAAVDSGLARASPAHYPD